MIILQFGAPLITLNVAMQNTANQCGQNCRACSPNISLPEPSLAYDMVKVRSKQSKSCIQNQCCLLASQNHIRRVSRSFVSWELFIYNKAFTALWHCFETWHPFKGTFFLPFCLDKKVAIIRHAKITCHNYGKKKISKSPEWQLFKMATFFWQKKLP